MSFGVICNSFSVELNIEVWMNLPLPVEPVSFPPKLIQSEFSMVDGSSGATHEHSSLEIGMFMANKLKEQNVLLWFDFRVCPLFNPIFFPILCYIESSKFS